MRKAAAAAAVPPLLDTIPCTGTQLLRIVAKPSPTYPRKKRGVLFIIQDVCTKQELKLVSIPHLNFESKWQKTARHDL